MVLIDNTRMSSIFNSGKSSTRSSAADGFGDLLDTFGSDGQQKGKAASAGNGYFGETAFDRSEAASLLDELSTWADMNVAEKIRAQYLDDNNLTEQALEAMPPEDRAAIEKDIADAIKRQFGLEDTDGAMDDAAGVAPA